MYPNPTVGAELEFLPLTEVSLFRLSPSVQQALMPIYQLAKIEYSKPLARQPKFAQLINIIYICGTINYFLKLNYQRKKDFLKSLGYTNPEEEVGEEFYCKLNRADIEKMHARILKGAHKYDSMTVESHEENCENLTVGNIQETVNRLFDRLESLKLIQDSGENCLNIGFDNSVHGSNKENIKHFLSNYYTQEKEKRDRRYAFKQYSGLEVGFPVCKSPSEVSELYSVVVTAVKSIGVHFPKSAGVHLHVSIEREDLEGFQYLNHLANVSMATAAASYALMEILPTTRRDNPFCLPLGKNAEDHIKHYSQSMTNLEYVQRKINMVKRGIAGDAELLKDRQAMMYEFALGVVYGLAPLQHEYNFKELNKYVALGVTYEELSSLVANVVRNPRNIACSPAPILKENPLPTFEWRILPATGDVHLQTKWIELLYTIIKTVSDYDYVALSAVEGKDYMSFWKYIDEQGYVEVKFENNLEEWRKFTSYAGRFWSEDFYDINDEDYWKYLNGSENSIINPEDNATWYEGQFYPSNLDTEADDYAIAFLSNAVNI
jgi:Putative amidoligase enzyme